MLYSNSTNRCILAIDSYWCVKFEFHPSYIMNIFTQAALQRDIVNCLQFEQVAKLTTKTRELYKGDITYPIWDLPELYQLFPNATRININPSVKSLQPLHKIYALFMRWNSHIIAKRT